MSESDHSSNSQKRNKVSHKNKRERSYSPNYRHSKHRKDNNFSSDSDSPRHSSPISKYSKLRKHEKVNKLRRNESRKSHYSTNIKARKLSIKVHDFPNSSSNLENASDKENIESRRSKESKSLWKKCSMKRNKICSTSSVTLGPTYRIGLAESFSILTLKEQMDQSNMEEDVEFVCSMNIDDGEC